LVSHDPRSYSRCLLVVSTLATAVKAVGNYLFFFGVEQRWPVLLVACPYATSAALLLVGAFFLFVVNMQRRPAELPLQPDIETQRDTITRIERSIL
jgi:Na+-driven multidrug efflux pump